MTTHKVSELVGPMLDGAVAKAEGLTFSNHRGKWCLALDESEDEMRVYEPSQDWELGGPIIERERIQLLADDAPGSWRAGFWALECEPIIDAPPYIFANEQCGPTPLVAAMRAYIASRFGETVELP